MGGTLIGLIRAWVDLESSQRAVGSEKGAEGAIVAKHIDSRLQFTSTMSIRLAQSLSSFESHALLF